MSFYKINTKRAVCKVVETLIGVAVCFGVLWVICSAASALLRIAGVS